jgi:hypothetical protein
MGVIMGTNAMRRSGALNFLGALGVKTPPGIATGKRTKEELAAAAAADAAAKTTVLGRMGTMVTAIKGRSAQITKLVDSLPVPDSVKSFVHDPKSLLPKSARDMLDTAQSSLGQIGEPADLESAEPPKESVVLATKSALKKGSRVTIAPTPTFSEDIVVDGGIQLTNTQARTPTQLRRPLRNTIMDDTYDVYDTDNLDNTYENTLIRDPAPTTSNFVRNPGSLGTQGGPFGPQGGPFGTQGVLPLVKPKIPIPTLPEGCKCEACLAAKAAHEPPPPSVSTADVMKQLEDLKKFMVEQMKPPAPVAPAPVAPAPVAPAPVPEQILVAPVTVPVSASEPAERLPKIVYPGNSWSNTPATNQTQSLTSNPEITFFKKEEPLPEVQVTEVPVVKAPELPVTEVPVTETPVTEVSLTETPVTEAQELTKVLETPVTETQEPPKVTLEVNAHELEEIRAILAERQKDCAVKSIKD